MKLEMRYWAGLVGDKVDKSEVNLKPSEFKMAPFAQIKPLIAEKDTPVEKGKPVVVNVQAISLPPNTIVDCLNEVRHALGSTINFIEYGRPSGIEEPKYICQTVFLPMENGVIKKFDLIGAIKVFFVRTGLIGKTIGLSQEKFDIVSEEKDGTLVWRENGNLIRKTQRMVDVLYKRVHIAMLEPVIANESLNVKKNELVKIKIERITLQPNTIVKSTGFMGNAYGSLLDVIHEGRPKKVEEERKISQALFLPIEDGKIEQGDMLGALAVYFIELEDLKPIVKGIEKTFTTVYRSGKGIIRRNVKFPPYGFRRSPTARWELLISEESRKLKAGDVRVISVRRLKLPKNTIVQPCRVMRHPYGVVLDTIAKKMSRVEEEKEIDKVVFLPIADGDVRRGELIGTLNVYSVEVSAIEKLKSWLKEWIGQKEIKTSAILN